MHAGARRLEYSCVYLVFLLFAFLLCAASPSVQRTGLLAVPEASDDVKRAVEEKGYRVVLDDGWTADFWFAHALTTATKDAAGALYPELANGEFVGVVSFPKGSSDYRGQTIPAGVYTLRYQSIPQDANHMGVSPNPDFLLVIPVAADGNPSENLPFKRLVSLSAKTTGTPHPAVFAMAPAGAVTSVAKDDQGMTILSVDVSTATAGKMEKVGIVLKGQATQ
jgi:hypothetical protein